MTAPISNTPLVSGAVAAAKDLPGLVANLQAVDPVLAQQITGKALIASKSIYGVVISTGLTWAVTKYALGWSPEIVDALSGIVVLVATAAFRRVSVAPITSWFVSKKTAPAAKPPTSGIPAASVIVAMIAFGALTACTVPQSATSLTPVAADALNTASPSTVTKLNASCPAIIQGIAVARAGAVVAGASAADLAKIDSDAALAKAGCDNIAVLAANDAKPPSPTNSGDSHAWMLALLSDAVKVASVVLPLVL